MKTKQALEKITQHLVTLNTIIEPVTPVISQGNLG